MNGASLTGSDVDPTLKSSPVHCLHSVLDLGPNTAHRQLDDSLVLLQAGHHQELYVGVSGADAGLDVLPADDVQHLPGAVPLGPVNPRPTDDSVSLNPDVDVAATRVEEGADGDGEVVRVELRQILNVVQELHLLPLDHGQLVARSQDILLDPPGLLIDLLLLPL